MPAPILARDQHRQLKRFGEADPVISLRRRLRDEQVLVLERSAEDGARVPLTADRIDGALGPVGGRRRLFSRCGLIADLRPP
jgi:hypothetical protein